MPKKKGELSIEERLEQSIVAKEEEPYKLPSNWVWAFINKLVDVRDGTHDSPEFYSEGYPLITSKNLKKNQISFENVKFISKEDMDKINQRSRVEKGDILYAMIGTIGNPIYCDFDSLGKFAVKNVAIFKPFDKKISKFLKYYLESENYKKLIETKVKGTTQKFIPLNVLRNILLPLPPLEEQKRIVEKLDSLFEKIQKIKEIIEEVKEKTTSRREAILSKAFSGELTEKWRGENHSENARELLVKINDEKLKLWEDECKKAEDEGRKKPAKPKLKTIDEMLVGAEEEPYKLPSNWIWTTWEEISDIFSSKRVLQKDWQKEGIPFYRTREIVALAKNELFSNELFISQEHYDSLAKETRMPKAGDLMVTGIGTIGICYLVKENDCFYYKDASVLCVSKKGDINSEYLKYLMKTPFMVSQIKKNSAGTTVDSLTINKYKTYKLPLPPLEEQKEIVRVLDKVFEEENRISELISLENKIEILEKTILDRAFRGELGTGNSDDEPAIELLKKCLEGKR